MTAIITLEEAKERLDDLYMCNTAFVGGYPPDTAIVADRIVVADTEAGSDKPVLYVMDVEEAVEEIDNYEDMYLDEIANGDYDYCVSWYTGENLANAMARFNAMLSDEVDDE